LDLDPGTVVANRYRISRPLGRGGMGEVFAAENIRTGRPVAIKLLRQDSKAKSSAIARFRQEARAAGSINSDHVTQVLDVEEDPEHGVVLVFELLEGESLIDRLKRTGPIPFDELWPIIEQVWMGLADAHRAGIIHRDLKPSNVFLERRPDGTTRVKILDFGISKVPKEVGGETLTEMGQSLGTFSFMPPEQIGKAKTVDHRADIYACSTLIYQSLTGQLPYSARNILVMVEMKSKTDARKLGDAMQGPVDPRVEAFVARGLARDASLRFPTTLDALDAWRDLRPAPGPSSAQQSSQPASGGSAARPRSQPPPHSGASQPSPSFPRAPAPPLIIETAGPLPRVNNDVVEMTTEETAATLAMPMPHLKKGQHAQITPPLAPRLDSAAASLGSAAALGNPPAAQQPQASLGPGGTQPVRVGRMPENLPERRSRPDDALSADASKRAHLPATPASYSPPPGVANSPPRAPRSQAAAPGLARTYDDASLAANAAEGRTQIYRPDDAAHRSRLEPSVPVKTKRGLPLLVVLVGFLVVGFVLVAGVMVLFKH
jgi:eukaryotic-like serine/threonine-protein kinase